MLFSISLLPGLVVAMLFNKCLFIHDPRIPHITTLKCTIPYVQGTYFYGLDLYSISSHTLLSYTDASWGGCPNNRRFTFNYFVYLRENLISWLATLSRFSDEAEYHSVVNIVFDSFAAFFLGLQCPITKATLVYCDNVNAV